MNNTTTLLILAGVGVGGYLLYRSMQQPTGATGKVFGPGFKNPGAPFPLPADIRQEPVSFDGYFHVRSYR